MDPKVRREQLDAKVDEVKAMLQAWAIEQNIVQPNERLITTLSLRVATNLFASKRAKPKAIERDLTDQDWERILSLGWSARQRARMEKIKAQGNPALWTWWVGELPAYDRVLRESGSSYRFLVTNKYVRGQVRDRRLYVIQ